MEGTGQPTCSHPLTCLPTGEEERRVFMTAVALGFNGRYNRLYTMTAQCLQKDLPRVGDSLQKVVASFTPPSPVI